MAKVTQRSLNAGELGPDASARSDLAKYESAVRSGLNCIVRAQGGMVNRTGFELIGMSIGAAPYSSLMIDFEAETGDSYILELSAAKMRIVKGDGFVLYPAGHPQAGQIVEIVMPYTAAELPGLKWTQSNDVMTITHPARSPRDLMRVDHHLWTIAEIIFDNTLGVPTGCAAVDHWNPDTDDNDSGFEPQHYTYRVAAIVDGEESLPSPPFTSTGGKMSQGVGTGTDLAYQGNWVDLTWNNSTGVDEWRVYKEIAQGGYFGQIGTARKNKFRDENVKPDTSRSTQEVIKTFGTNNNRPGVCEYHQQRRIFARTNNGRQSFWGTRVSSYASMSAAKPAQEDDAFEYTLANRRRQEILWIISLGDSLILMTKTAEWAVKGRESAVISASKPPGVKVNTNYGSASLKPQLVGDEVIFVQGDRRTVRALGYSFEKDALAGQDLTLLANHLFEDRQIQAWTYAGAPYRTFFFVFTDGGMAAMTYMRDQEIWGVTRLETDGFVEDVQSVQLASDDAGVYIIVQRAKGDGSLFRSIEKLHARLPVDLENAFYVDSGLTFSGERLTPTAMLVTGGGTRLTYAGHGLATNTPVRLRYVAADGEHERTGTADVTSTSLFYVQDGNGERITFADGAILASIEITRMASVISGLDHLEGRVVVALADGNVEGADDDGPTGALVVTNGAVTLGSPAGHVHVGLPYLSEIETLDIDSSSDTIAGVKKNLKGVWLKVRDTRGVQVGATRDKLYPQKWRSTELYAQATRLYSGKVLFDTGSTWGEDGVAIIRQCYPLPMHVLSITPDFEFGE